MALTFNLPSQIVVQTAAQWAVDATVYSNKRILVTSDAYYGSTDQRKFKIADGTQTWAQLDYMPISQTLAQVLANGNSTNGLSFDSPDSLTYLLVKNNNIDAVVDNNNTVSEINITPNTIVISTTGASIDLSATSVTKNGAGIATVNDIVQVTTSTIGSAINGAASATPNDTDLVMSVESSVAKKNTWTQIKAFLKTYFDTLYATVGSLSGKEDTSNKSDSYTVSSTTTYANTKALVDGLASVSADRKDFSYFRKTGTTTYERWYSTNFTNAALTTYPYLAKDVIRAIPFIVSKTTTLDRIGMEITGAGTAASVLRLGIYDDVNGVPTNLILDAGTIAADSATAQTITISQVLTPGLYYLTFVHNSAATITVRAHQTYTQYQTCGFNASWNATQNAGTIASIFVYSTLPSTFSTSSITPVSASVVPAIFVRLSA